MSQLIFKLNIVAGVLLSAAAFAQDHGNNSQADQNILSDVALKMNKHVVQRQLLQAGRSAQSGVYAAETKVGAPGMESVTPYFSKIKLPPQAYIEVSDPGQKEVYLYGQKDFGELRDGELFASVSISGEYARIRIVYPAGTAPGPDDAVVLEHWESPPENSNRNISSYAIIGGKDERELTPCVTAKKPEWNHASLATVYMAAGGSTGTSWSLGNDNFMVTNHHVVNNQENLSRGGEARFQYITSGCKTSEPAHVLKIKPDKLLVTGGSGRNDYTLFTLDAFDYQHAKVKNLFGGLELDVRNPTQNSPLYIPQHGRLELPEGRRYYQTIAYTKAKANCKVTEVGSTIGHNCDTMPGSSGSPVVSQNNGKAVGLHYAAGNEVNRAVTAETLWQAIQPYVTPQQNQAVVGMGKLNLAQVSVSKEQLPVLGQRFSDMLSFEALSGRWLGHEKTYTKIAAASQDIQSGKTYEIVYRVSQSVNGQHYNLQQAIAGSKTLSVTYVAGDNLDVSSQGPHKSWLGFKAKATNGVLANNYLIKVNNTIPGNGNDNGEPTVPPQAEISGPAEIMKEEGGAILSAEASTGDKLKYQWSNDSQLLLLPNQDKVIVHAGTSVALGWHQVKLTVTDSKGRSATAVHALQVKGDDGYTPPQARISGDATVKAGETLALSAENSVGSELKYLWSNSHGLKFLPGNHAQKVQVIVPAGAQAGQVYSFKLAVTDSLNKKHETSHAVTVKKDINGNAPVARISGGQPSYTAGKSIRLDGGGSTGHNGALSYQWTASPALNMGNTSASAVAFTAPDVKKETAYQVTLTVKDKENGKEHRVSHTMSIKPKEDGGKPPTGDNWDAAMVYKTPCTKVTYKGKEWMNGWEIRGIAPGSDGLWGAWRERGASNMHGACKGK